MNLKLLYLICVLCCLLVSSQCDDSKRIRKSYLMPFPLSPYTAMRGPDLSLCMFPPYMYQYFCRRRIMDFQFGGWWK
jgi:hypothetical protein